MSNVPPSLLESQNTIIDHPFHGFSDVRNPEFHPPAPPSRPPPAVPRKSYSGVSERPSAASPHPIPVNGQNSRFGMQQGIRSPSSGSISVGKTGLKNLGNTCYMNSILQCMSGTTPLARYFLGGSYRAHINKENPLGSRGVLAEAFANVIRHLWSGEYKFISPVTFKVDASTCLVSLYVLMGTYRTFRVDSTKLSQHLPSKTLKNSSNFSLMVYTKTSIPTQTATNLSLSPIKKNESANVFQFKLPVILNGAAIPTRIIQ